MEFPISQAGPLGIYQDLTMVADDKTIFQFPCHGARIGKELSDPFTWRDAGVCLCKMCL